MERRRILHSLSSVSSSCKWLFLLVTCGALFCRSSAYVGRTTTQSWCGWRQPFQSARSTRAKATRAMDEEVMDASKVGGFGKKISTIDDDLVSRLEDLCRTARFESAMELLVEYHRGEGISTDLTTTTSWYLMILNALEARSGLKNGEAVDASVAIQTCSLAKHFLRRMLALGEASKTWLPTTQIFDKVFQLSASAPSDSEVSDDCNALLKTLWSLYHASDDDEAVEKVKFLPMKDTYIAAIRSCSMRDRAQAAKCAENLMEEMKVLCVEYPHLTPDRAVANEVLTAWCMSGRQSVGWKKCEAIIQDMIDVARKDHDRHDIMPNTTSFNILLHSLARSKDKNSEVRAEDWLRKMESLSAVSSYYRCLPDEYSFNIVLNGWARSRIPGSAQRATDILNHMKKRHEAGLTEVHPGDSTYATVLNGWARSRESNAIQKAESIFAEYVEACQEGKWNMTHNALTYNSMINCYAKSRRSDAGDRALELFQTMKMNIGKPGWDRCFVDTYTYTSVVDAIAKRESLEASELAISLLEEIEASHKQTGDRRFQPTIQLYTSVVNAIGRSHKSPERAQAIVDRVESSYLEGMSQGACKPDVVFYNALINAYGWSDIEGRWEKCLQVLQRMIALYESKLIVDLKPDTVSFNSVLNACAFEHANSQEKRDNIIKAVVETYELLQRQPKGGYGKPDQSTYAQVLMAIVNHVAKDDDRRIAMAESIFLQCAENGLVGVQIIMRLHSAVPYSQFCELVGPALNQPATPEFANQKPMFDLSKLPAEWTANAPYSNTRIPPTQSRRRRGNFLVTKDLVGRRGRHAKS